MEFLQQHEVFPTMPDKLIEEVKEHEKFLDQKQLELEELKSLLTSLKSFALLGDVSESRIEYVSVRILNKLPNRISLIERRISAFKTFSVLNELKRIVS